MSKYVLNTMYLKAKYIKDDYAPPNSSFAMKKVCDDALIMTIKDDETNTSEIKIIERPTIEYYTVKEEYKDQVNPWQEQSISKDLLDTHVVEYSKRDADICKYLGIYDEYYRLKQAANKKYFTYEEAVNARNAFKDFMNKKVYMSPYIYSADETIEVFWKTKLMKEEHMDSIPKILNVSFYDIETLIAHFKTQVDQHNPEAPVNVITYCNTKKMHFYALLLKIPEIKSVQDEIESNIDEYFDKYIQEDFKDRGFERKNIHIKFFDSEIMLIKAFFQLIHEDKPDFAMAWNSNYDNVYLMNRSKKLGLDPAELFCHPDVPEQYRRFRYIEDPGRGDNNNPFAKGKKKAEYSRMWDWIVAPGYTCYIDQMSLYSNSRKRWIFKSYKLDAIAEKEVGANKVDLHDFGLNIRNAPIKNFKIFLKYSMRDTLLLYLIEEKNKDLTQYIALSDNTDLKNGTHESMIIRNAFLMKFYDQNRAIGNKVDYGVLGSITGALVQDPMDVEVEPVEVNGSKTRMFRNVLDFDAKSLYPSLMCQHYIDKSNHAYRVVSITENGNLLMDGERFNSLLETIDVGAIDLGHDLYGLPNIEDVISDIESKLQKL